MGDKLKKAETAMRESIYGYPEYTDVELGVQDFFRDNPDVAGMAWGGGMNNSPKNEKRSVVANPYNPYMSDKTKRKALLKIEAARHLMDETGYSPTFKITGEQQKWRKNLGAYADDDLAAKQSIVSRIVGGDHVPEVSPEQRAEAQRIGAMLEERGNINLETRPVVKNKDGSISTIRSMSIGTDEGEVLIPTIADDGAQLSDKQAIDLYRKTGQHLGIFKTPEEATAYAKSLSERQGKR